MGQEFRLLIESSLPKLRHYALGLARNKADADDLLQDALLRAWRSQDQFTIGTNFRAWMYRILRNAFISKYRATMKRTSSLSTMPEGILSSQGRQENVIMLAEVQRAISLMDPIHGEILDLASTGEMSYDEIAEVLECSVGTVKSRLWRARGHVKALIEGPPKRDVDIWAAGTGGDQNRLQSTANDTAPTTSFGNEGGSERPYNDLIGKNVMVVEDNMLIAGAICDALCDAGAKVIGPFPGVEKAMKGAAQQQLDGAVLDVNLRSGFSFPVASALKARGIPFAFITGYRNTIVPFEHRNVLLMHKPLHPKRIVATAAQTFRGVRGKSA